MKRIVWLLLMPLTGCAWMYSALTGIKEPVYETPSWQKQYLLEKNIDTLYLANLKSGYQDSLRHLRHSLDTFSSNGFTPIQFRIYNGEGDFYSGWEICFGNAEKSEIYRNFPHKSPEWWALNDRLNFRSDLELIEPINFNLDEVQKTIAENKYDFIVVSMWAGYLGKLSANMLKNIDAAIGDNRRILHIKVNLGE